MLKACNQFHLATFTKNYAGAADATRAHATGSKKFRKKQRLLPEQKPLSKTGYKLSAWRTGESAAAPPVADAARRFQGSAPSGGHECDRQAVGATRACAAGGKKFRKKQRLLPEQKPL